MVTVKVKPFFEVREILGESRLEIEVKEGTTVKGLLMQLIASYGPRLREVLLNPETEELKPFFWILLGGREVSQLQEGINTPSKSLSDNCHSKLVSGSIRYVTQR